MNTSDTLLRPAINRAAFPEFDVQAALEAGEIGIWDWDLATGRMSWSKQMYHNLGLDTEASDNLFGCLLKAINSTERENVAAAFAEFRSRPGPIRIEARLAWPRGESHSIVFLGRTVLGNDGGPGHMLGITIDSTRRRKNEEDSAAAILASERRLRELTERLQDLAERQHRLLGASRAQFKQFSITPRIG